MLRNYKGLDSKYSVSFEFVRVYKQLQLKWEVPQVLKRKKSTKKSSHIFDGQWNTWKAGHWGRRRGKLYEDLIQFF